MNPGTGKKSDFLGVGDFIAFRCGFDNDTPCREIAIIQATVDGNGSKSNHNARVRKIYACGRLRFWYRAGGTVWVYSWRKTNRQWVLHREQITEEMWLQKNPSP
jgi:hypothetical protein